MPLCHDRQFIFFHIPRCGGTSLEVFFNFRSHDQLHGVRKEGQKLLTLHHMTAVDLAALGLIDNDTLQSYFKFTVIRDPFDRMASDYIWQRKHDRHGEFGRLDFRDYLRKAETVIRDERYFEKLHYDHFRPMVDYCIHDGELLVDDILILDNIDREMARLEHKLGPVRLPRLNHVSDYSGLRTTSHLDVVYRIYECDKVLYENTDAIRPTV
jgi:hypothetical protein